MTAPTAHKSIQSFYEAINRRDINAAMEWIDPQCIYEDLNFSQPFQGKKAVRGLLEESCKGIPNELQFVIDELTTGDCLAVGVLWHVELDGIPFPNGRGVSFYRFSEVTGKMVNARDLVEPPIKPGKASFFIIRLVSPLVRRLLKHQHHQTTQKKSASERPTGKSRSFLSFIFWLIAITYIYILLLSPPGQLVPGEPAWAIRPETIQEILNESLNFFLVLPLLNLAGIHYIKAPTVHPIIEALFNFAEAWIFMFLPLLLADRNTAHLPKILIWSMGCVRYQCCAYPLHGTALQCSNFSSQGGNGQGWVSSYIWLDRAERGHNCLNLGFCGQARVGRLGREDEIFRRAGDDRPSYTGFLCGFSAFFRFSGFTFEGS